MVEKLYTPTNLELIQKINEIIANLGGGSLDFYGTCSTSAATRDKVVVCPELTTLKEGISIRVKFTNAQTYNGAPTLNVNSTGAKTIQLKVGTNAARYVWQAGEIVAFTYDGTSWVMADSGVASTTYYGITRLAATATSGNTATALVPAALNKLVEDMIEPYDVYSTSDTYEVGERRRYSFKVWECITPITTPEAWTEEHWTAIDPIQTQLDNKVSNTDYANSATGGVIKTSSTTGAGITAAGVLYASNSSFATYQDASNFYFISKGTLENVFIGKGFCKKITEPNPALTSTNGICTWTVTNSLSTADVTVVVKDAATNKHIVHEAVSTANTITIKIISASDIAAGSLKVVITG